MTITTVGIDLAKNVFAVHGVDQNGRRGSRSNDVKNHAKRLIHCLY